MDVDDIKVTITIKDKAIFEKIQKITKQHDLPLPTIVRFALLEGLYVLEKQKETENN